MQTLGVVDFEGGIGPTYVHDARLSPTGDRIYITGASGSGTTANWVFATADFNLTDLQVKDLYNPGSGARAWQMASYQNGIAVVGAANSGAGNAATLRFSSDLQSWTTLDQYQYSGENTNYYGVTGAGRNLLMTGFVNDVTNTKLISFVRKYDGASSSSVFEDNSGISPGGPVFSRIKGNGFVDYTLEYETVDGVTPATMQVVEVKEGFSLSGNTVSFSPFSQPQKTIPIDFAVAGTGIFAPAYGPSGVDLMLNAGGAWSIVDTLTDPARLGSGLLASRTGPVLWALGAGDSTSTLQLNVRVLRDGIVRPLIVPVHYTDNTTNEPNIMVELPDGDIIILANSHSSTQALEQTIAYRIPCK